jgi:hypothetical protein
MKSQIVCLAIFVVSIAIVYGQYFSAPEGRITIGRLGKRTNRISLIDINNSKESFVSDDESYSNEDLYRSQNQLKDYNLPSDSSEDLKRRFLKKVILKLQKSYRP